MVRSSSVDSGFYAACAGLRAKSQALEIVANNVANLSSTMRMSRKVVCLDRGFPSHSAILPRPASPLNCRHQIRLARGDFGFQFEAVR
jgi:hypothetical protein